MRALIDLLVPPCCDGCGRASAPPWCGECERERLRVRPVRPCARCGGEDVAGHGCWVAEPPLDELVTLGRWTGGVARAVVRAKLAGRREVMVAAGRMLGAVVDGRGIRPDRVVGVPTDRGRARRRGRDHTRALAQGAADALGVATAAPFSRVSGTRDRVGPGERPDRREPAPRVRTASSAGRSVLVVDDVVTTGWTLSRWCAALSAAGARRVDAAVVGRAGDRPLGGARW